MKKLFKISLGILVVGLVLTLVGFFGHGARDVHFNGAKPALTKHINQNLLANRQFDRLDVDSISADVTVKTGPKFSVVYRGTDTTRPKVILNDGRVTVMQTKTVAGTFWNNVDDAEVTITVPRGTKLTGTIKTVDGDVTVNGVDLSEITVDSTDGDVDFHNMTVTTGKVRLSGDFTSHNVTYLGKSFVKNSDGDNEVVNTRVDGYFLKTSTGENDIDGSDHDAGELEANSGADNFLRLTTVDGDNEVKNLQAVQ